MTIQVSLSHSFHNKELRIANGIANPRGESFIAMSISAPDFIQHILEGNAWAVGTYTDDHRKGDKFIQSQILALDFDDSAELSIKEAMKHPDIARYAALVHATPSHTEEKPRTRVIFILNKSVPDSAKWERAAAAALYHFAALQPDTSCKDCARFYFGSDVAVQEAARLPEHRLPISIVAAWVKTWQMAQEEEQRQLSLLPGVPELPKRDRAERYAEVAFDRTVTEVAEAVEGTRNDLLNKAAYKLYGMALSSWPGIDSLGVTRRLTQAALASGLEKAGIAATLHSAENAAMPIPLILDAPHRPLGQFNAEDVTAYAEQKQATIDTLQRSLVALSWQVKNGGASTDEIQKLAQEMMSATDGLLALAGHVRLVSGTEAALAASRQMAYKMENPSQILGLSSGLRALDYAIGGFAPGYVYTCLGDTGTGKTTLMATLALAFASQTPGLIIPAESSAVQFSAKMTAACCRIPFGDLERGGRFAEINGAGMRFETFTGEDKRQIDLANKRVIIAQQSGTQLIDGGSVSPAVVLSLLRQHKDKIGWVIVDSVDAIRLPYYASEYEHLSAAAELVEKIAVEYGVPVVCTSQIGRNTKGRASKTPELHDAAGSNWIERKSSVVLALYNHWYHVDQEHIHQETGDENKYPRGTVHFITRKVRAGRAGIHFDLAYLGGCGFYNAVKGE